MPLCLNAKHIGQTYWSKMVRMTACGWLVKRSPAICLRVCSEAWHIWRCFECSVGIRVVEDYAVVFFGSSLFKILRLFIVALFTIHFFTCLFYHVKASTYLRTYLRTYLHTHARTHARTHAHTQHTPARARAHTHTHTQPYAILKHLISASQYVSICFFWPLISAKCGCYAHNCCLEAGIKWFPHNDKLLRIQRRGSKRESWAFFFSNHELDGTFEPFMAFYCRTWQKNMWVTQVEHRHRRNHRLS